MSLPWLFNMLAGKLYNVKRSNQRRTRNPHLDYNINCSWLKGKLFKTPMQFRTGHLNLSSEATSALFLQNMQFRLSTFSDISVILK